MLPNDLGSHLPVSVDRSWKTPGAVGAVRARDGASMKWTNLVSSKVCKHFWVFREGSVRASAGPGRWLRVGKREAARYKSGAAAGPQLDGSEKKGGQGALS